MRTGRTGGRPLKSFEPIPALHVHNALSEIIGEAFAASTWQNSLYSVEKYNRFVKAQGIQHHESTEKLVTYIGAMQCEELLPSSILTEVGNVVRMLKLSGEVVGSPTLSVVMKGLHRMKAHTAPNRARPIDKDTLLAVLESMADIRAAGILAIGWVLASRIGDVRRIRFDALEVDEEADVARVRWTERKDVAHVGTISSAHLGPFKKYVIKMIQGRGSDEQLGEHLTTATVAAMLPQGFTAHSIRRGAAQTALRNGASPESVRTLTLHASIQSLLRYAPMAYETMQLEASSHLV